MDLYRQTNKAIHVCVCVYVEVEREKDSHIINMKNEQFIFHYRHRDQFNQQTLKVLNKAMKLTVL